MAAEPGYRGRFAPSPTGPLHFGSLLAAFGSWLDARHQGGEWLLRIEDVDRTREVPGAADRQLATLLAFGLRPDGPVLRQSSRGEAYAAALERLVETGHAFRCSCSRSDLAAAGGIHRRCVRAPQRHAAVRLRVPDLRIGFDDRVAGRQSQQLAEAVGDFVLRRADGIWAYQFAVVVDDAAQGITDVVRGADLLDSTPRQILLQRLLGLPTPRYLHLPLVVDAQGRKLGKSTAALALDPQAPLPTLRRAWAALGQAPAAVAAAADCAGFLRAAQVAFDPGRIDPAPLSADRIDGGQRAVDGAV